jgi:hypothetical protein
MLIQAEVPMRHLNSRDSGHDHCRHLALILATLYIWVCASAGAAEPDAINACESLAAHDWSAIVDAPTTLTSTDTVAASEGLPAHCRVAGYVAPAVHFELRLPLMTASTDWNGKFLMQGCGGLCGAVSGASCDDALARHYAVVATDMGHSAPAYDAQWALNNRSAEIDFAYRATHVVAIAAKTLVTRFYGSAPRYSYFRGCSTGGRQGLVEAQRFPDDFDGIIAGAPVLNETATAALHLIWSGMANLDADDRPVLTPAKVQWVHETIIAACAGDDGLDQRWIEDPRTCDWEAQLPACDGNALPDCLSPRELQSLRKLYGGARNSAGQQLTPGGVMPGSEYEWVPNFVGQDGPAVFHPDGPIKQLYQNLIFLDDPGPGHSARDFDFDRDPARMAMMEVIYSAMNPDLRKYRDRGGKLILYQGWDDIEVTPLTTIDYFVTMTATMGGAEQAGRFARLFMLPGVAHCRRGPGADTVDWLTALERWVEEGQAPASVMAYHPVVPQNYRGLPRARFPLAAQAYDWSRLLGPYAE